MEGTCIVPSPRAEGWVWMDSPPLELARVAQGKLFEKHILNKGTLIHPQTGERIQVDDAFIDRMMANFENNVCDIVQVPVANDDNKHVESPVSNIGEVVGLRSRGGKVYAVVDARDPQAADRLGKTYLGASAFLSTNYTDSRTGQKAGPTLLHVAVTNRPYVVGLEPYREIVAATAAESDNQDVVVLTQEENVPLTREEMIAALKAEHGIDVDALMASALQGQDGQGGLTAALASALPLNALGLASGETITPDDLVGAVVELSRQNVTLASGYDGMRRERAEEVVDQLIGDGFILPKQRDFAVKLKLANEQDFAEFVPDKPLVETNKQVGFTAPRDEAERADQQEEIVRLTGAYKEYFDPEAAGANGGRRRR